MKIKLFTFAVLVLLVGCSDAKFEKATNFGGNAKIECWSGSIKIFDGISTGKIENEEQSDGYYFKDKSDGKLKAVSGNCVITYQ